MLESSKTIEFDFNSLKEGDPILVEDVAKFLDSLQSLINHLGDYLAGSDYRRSGSSLESVLNSCRLIFDKVEIGSFTATLGLQDRQTVLGGYQTLGEECIQKVYDIFKDLEMDANLDDILASISNSLHRTRIIEDIYKILPNEHSKFKIRFKTPQGSYLELRSSYKLVLKGLLSEESRENVSTKGVLSMIQVTPNKQKTIRIIGPDGKINCNFPKELEETAKKLLGKPVIIYGYAVFEASGNIKEITEVNKIKQFTDLELSRIFSGTEELQFSQPLVVSVDYKDDQWIMENSELGAISTNANYVECLDDFHKEVLFVWKEYGQSNEVDLTKDALDLRNKILEYVEPISQ